MEKKNYILICVYLVTDPSSASRGSHDWAWSSRDIHGKNLYLRDLTVKSALRKIKAYRAKYPTLKTTTMELGSGTTLYQLSGFYD